MRIYMTKRNRMINGSDIKRNWLITALTIIPFNVKTNDNYLDTNRISPKLLELIVIFLLLNYGVQ